MFQECQTALVGMGEIKAKNTKLTAVYWGESHFPPHAPTLVATR